MNGPPKYLTPDWVAAFDSVKKLAVLNPSVAVTGHGVPMSGSELNEGLRRLVNDFNQIALPNNKK